mgnify:CR=1 FL=1
MDLGHVIEIEKKNEVGQGMHTLFVNSNVEGVTKMIRSNGLLRCRVAEAVWSKMAKEEMGEFLLGLRSAGCILLCLDTDEENAITPASIMDVPCGKRPATVVMTAMRIQEKTETDYAERDETVTRKRDDSADTGAEDISQNE